MRDRDRVAFFESQLLEGLDAEPELFRTGDLGCVDDVQGCKQRVLTGLVADLHLRQRLEAFAAVNLAITVQVCDVLLVGVDRYAPDFERLLRIHPGRISLTGLFAAMWKAVVSQIGYYGYSEPDRRRKQFSLEARGIVESVRHSG